MNRHTDASVTQVTPGPWETWNILLKQIQMENRETGRQTDRQTDRRTDRQIPHHHIPQATNIPYQALFIKAIFSVLVHAEKQFFSKLVFKTEKETDWRISTFAIVAVHCMCIEAMVDNKNQTHHTRVWCNVTKIQLSHKGLANNDSCACEASRFIVVQKNTHLELLLDQIMNIALLSSAVLLLKTLPNWMTHGKISGCGSVFKLLVLIFSMYPALSYKPFCQRLIFLRTICGRLVGESPNIKIPWLLVKILPTLMVNT